MPKMDGTGPMGVGAMSGRGLGICKSSNTKQGGCRRAGLGRSENADAFRQGGCRRAGLGRSENANAFRQGGCRRAGLGSQ